jgi:hypothetical protein
MAGPIRIENSSAKISQNLRYQRLATRHAAH